jgi:hypothetical protein
MTGYNEAFLAGIALPIPKFKTELSAELLSKWKVFDYPNYSVVMNG